MTKEEGLSKEKKKRKKKKNSRKQRNLPHLLPSVSASSAFRVLARSALPRAKSNSQRVAGGERREHKRKKKEKKRQPAAFLFGCTPSDFHNLIFPVQRP